MYPQHVYPTAHEAMARRRLYTVCIRAQQPPIYSELCELGAIQKKCLCTLLHIAIEGTLMILHTTIKMKLNSTIRHDHMLLGRVGFVSHKVGELRR